MLKVAEHERQIKNNIFKRHKGEMNLYDISEKYSFLSLSRAEEFSFLFL